MTITETSSSMGTYLYLIDPAGNVVAQNGAGAGNADSQSRIVYTPSVSGAWRIEATSFVAGETGSYTLSVACAPGGARFMPVAPCRVLDTRESSGPTASSPALEAGARRLFTVAGLCGVPWTAVSIVGNLTAVGATAAGSLTVTGGHLADTSTSTISFSASRPRANNAIIQLATDGSGTIAVTNTSTGSVHLVLDVSGYFE